MIGGSSISDTQGPSPTESTSADHFEHLYGEAGRPPWDVDGPQPALVNAAQHVVGAVLDVGCGTGENALYFAARGHSVTGLDFLELPLQRAREKAKQQQLSVEWFQGDARHLQTWDRSFDTVLDCGLFHGLSDFDREVYIDGVLSVLRPGGKLLLLCFSDREPPGDGPRRIAREELEAVFNSDYWAIESIEPTQFSVREDTALSFSPGGPHAWFGIFRRVG